MANAVEQFFGKVAVRVNEPDAVAGGDVLHDEIAQQRRFSRTRLSDEIEVVALVGSRNAEGDVVPQPCLLPILVKCSFMVPKPAATPERTPGGPVSNVAAVV